MRVWLREVSVPESGAGFNEGFCAWAIVGYSEGGGDACACEDYGVFWGVERGGQLLDFSLDLPVRVYDLFWLELREETHELCKHDFFCKKYDNTWFHEKMRGFWWIVRVFLKVLLVTRNIYLLFPYSFTDSIKVKQHSLSSNLLIKLFPFPSVSFQSNSTSGNWIKRLCFAS